MSGCDPCSGGGRGEEQLKQMAEMPNNLKEGERLLAPSRRPDGSFWNPIRIRAGYVPQEEIAIYQSKGALVALEKGMNSDVALAGERIEMIRDSNHGLESVTSLAMQFDGLAGSPNCAYNNAPSAVIEDANSAGSGEDIGKRIRTLKKKIRLAEGQQQKNGEKDLSWDQQEKLAKLEGWRQQLKILEQAKAKPPAS